MSTPAGSRRGFRWATAAVAVAALGMLAFHVHGLLRDRFPAIVLRAPAEPDPAPAWRDHPEYAEDPATGLRPRRGTEVELRVAPLGGGAATTVRRRIDRFGLVRADDLPERVTGPRILLLGDGQVMGQVTAEENVAHLVEAALRADRWPGAHVLNAGCEFTGLYQHVLRARQLAPQFAPHLIVAVVSTGDDLVALDDASLPHLTDVVV